MFVLLEVSPVADRSPPSFMSTTHDTGGKLSDTAGDGGHTHTCTDYMLGVVWVATGGRTTITTRLHTITLISKR